MDSQKYYLLVYDIKEDGLNVLNVIDPDITLENGNKQVLKVFIGSYADRLVEELTIGHFMNMEIGDDDAES